MLDAIKKKLGMTQVQEKETEMTIEIPQGSTEMSAQLAELTEKFDAKSAEFTALLEKTASLEASLKDTQEKLAAKEAEFAATIKQAAQAKLAARKEKIEAAIGTEKADGLMLATEALDDTAFNAVLSALVGSVEAEAKTDAFKEVGVDAKAKASVQDPVERLKQRLDEEIKPRDAE